MLLKYRLFSRFDQINLHVISGNWNTSGFKKFCLNTYGLVFVHIFQVVAMYQQTPRARDAFKSNRKLHKRN